MFPRLALILIFVTAAVTAQAESVTITRPGAGASVSSPVRVTASAQGSSAVWLMQVYVDGVKKYEAKAASLDKSLTMASGSRRITVVAHDKDSVFKSSVTVNVSGSTTTTTSGSTSSSTETVNTDIEQRTGWQDCDACSGPDGAGEQIGYSMQQNIASPSKDGNSAKFRIWANDDGDHYGSALWWKELGGKDASTNFVYELDFYLKDPTKAQALEFDVNQLHSGHKTKYIFGTECDIKGTKQWRYYDNVAKKWAATGVTCAMPTAYTWNHLMLEFKRVSDGRLQFIAVTLNGKKSYFNKYSNRNTGTANYAHINVAVQLDGNSSTAAYDMWVDNVKLRHW
jgi:hypothetical protein